jgi:cyclic beta-1,2-glucan synthetase
LIRAELFSAERLEQHAETLAAAQLITRRPVTVRSLAERLRDNDRILLDAYRKIAKAIGEDRAITPAAKWLVDNYHVIEAQIRQIGDDLPPGYYRQLPKLADGPLAGYPRVFGLAWAFVAHTDSRFEAQLLCRFVGAYQRVQPLTIGELWAVAITLRIVLVENLRRVAERIEHRRAARQQADALAERILADGLLMPEPLLRILQAWDGVPLSTPFAVQLLHRLSDQGAKVAPALAWLERRFAGKGSADDLVRDEHHQQGASTVTVRNVITSMRSISAVDWPELFESVSLVDAVLRGHTGYAVMDFATRDRYRGAIEELARSSPHTEIEIAALAVEAAGRGLLSHERDPGYPLISSGRRAFEARVGFRIPLRTLLGRISSAAGIRGYIGGVLVVAGVILALPLLALATAGTGYGLVTVLGILGVVPSIGAAMALVNSGVTHRFGARVLPALELRDGVPAQYRTLVVIPTLLSTQETLAEHLERLEIHHVASLDGDIHFALLTDWTDAAEESMPGDDALLDAAAAGIACLNRRYGPAPGGERFLLLHRRRIWDAAQDQWMGWERKRGKLHELNLLLRGSTDTTFVAIDGCAPSGPRDVRYVITLDADTRLPRDSVRRLVGKMVHPLNRPRFDTTLGRVVEGYGVLQPRVAPSLPIGREGSMFQRLFSSAGGIDPYASAVSDVYQDLCGEGSYVGKGIYDIDAFETALAGRVPDGTLLSHDLFEGIFARAGLVSDIEVVEEYPSRYDVAAARAHRWARGDWQLLPWILGRGPRDGHRRTPVPLIGRWKMLDNLRRTLLAPATLFALVIGWTLPLRAAAIWTAFVLATIAVPNLPALLAGVIPRRRGLSMRSHLRALFEELRLALSLTLLLLVLVAHQAWIMCDAIGRTLVRLLLTRRHLLEWVTTAQAQMNRRLNLPGFYRCMASAVAIGAGVAVLAYAGLIRAPLALPFALLWILSPVIASWISRAPPTAERSGSSVQDAHALRLIARRAWSYFDTFVTLADHMLPPDNFQEDPLPVIAHRTSPTNLGLYLLSIVTARDLGWIGALDMVERLEATLSQMARLERFRGHFYNWYDTQDLRPLDPKYISSVDSGNLAAHLITLANACTQIAGGRPTDSDLLAGIADGLALTCEVSSRRPKDDLDRALQALGESMSTMPAPPLAAFLALLEPLGAAAVACAQAVAVERDDAVGAEVLMWAQSTHRTISSHLRDVAAGAGAGAALAGRLAALADTARSMAQAMRFDFLYESAQRLLSIGYRVVEGNLDPNCYDLLASEARLASFMAIANGDLPARHWFRLGRAVTPIHCGAALVSWSGSMFEYLMPSLVMRAPAGSLLEQTSRLIVWRQRTYGDERGVPWGISESAYNARDRELTYQYSSFGVPGLGLKRGLAENTVIAPYATALAAMIEPHSAVLNFAKLADHDARGLYGFYEALDFTPQRLPAGHAVAIVRAYMAHHQGMTLVAIANTLLNGVMRARFHSEPCVQATELLLQERTPRDVAVAHVRAAESAAGTKSFMQTITRRLPNSPHDPTPPTRLLSNGRYAVMLTAAGSGYSRWRDLAVTRWREDATCDAWGSYIFLRDVDSGAVWSATHQPACAQPDECQIEFNEDRAEFIRRDGSVTTTLTVIVSAESDAEVRRVSITNTGNRVRQVELTSYAELVLATPAADTAHPAFSKLFVQTEHVPEIGALVATRRRRSSTEPEVWAAHLEVTEGESVGELQFETDRARFLGRARELRSAVAITQPLPLSGTVGTVLDPVFSLRRRVRVPPGVTVRVAFWTLVAASRRELLDLADKHQDAAAFDRAQTLAWTQAQVQLHHLSVSVEEASLFQRLAGHMVYSNPSLRPSSAALRLGGGGQPLLWAQGISGDLPIVVVRIDDIDDLDVVRQMLRAFEYWRLKQLAVDLVILNERTASYIQEMQSSLESLIGAALARPDMSGATKGRAYILRSDVISSEARATLLTAARAVILSRRGSLAEQFEGLDTGVPPIAPAAAALPPVAADVPPLAPELEFFNGIGGFAADGEEYVTVLRDGRCTPAPWINVVANPAFGFQVSAEGAGYTWAGNSRENQLTPWSNDPIGDRPGEVIYLRDADAGALWGPTAAPIRLDAATYVARHGRGYSCFEHTQRGIELVLLQLVPLDAAVKISRLTIRNLSGRIRHLSVTAYVEWVLGTTRAASAPYISTEMDAVTNALLARNLWAGHESRVAFLDLGGRQTSWSGDRQTFLGRNGTLQRPLALTAAAPLSGRVGAGLDPCGALQTTVELAANSSIDIVWLVGEAATAHEARELITHWRSADISALLVSVRRHWADVLGAVAVRTPDRSFDLMLNGWLLYQTIACRVWARSAFYQASGAYGFRDQLQDTMALIVANPKLAREHLLRAAGRQFTEGDVQHWWLPQTGRGVRTRVSDDRAWLCYCVAHFIETTGDLAILDEIVPYLEGPPLRAGESDNFFQPSAADETSTLFEHCARALEASLGVGPHGLPLIGSGDWNDGMNLVGAAGRGESIWLGWFLINALSKFVPLAQARGEQSRAVSWRAHAVQLQGALEHESWDGNWYLRGYFDDGTPLGSAAGSECRIDSIAQSWGVISGAADPQRVRTAMAAVDQQLVSRDSRMVLLFTPPFDRSAPDPGYVKAYPPGIRENGGQYTHAAVWSVIAFAMLGEGDLAAELFSLLNPINHTRTYADAMLYKVEPYVIAADVYSVPPHVGRGGWTWYTGSAAWLYRAGLESILGCRIHGEELLLDPCVPRHWPRFEIALQYRGTRYEITVTNPHGVNRGVIDLKVDGQTRPIQPAVISLTDDGGTHHILAVIGVLPPAEHAQTTDIDSPSTTKLATAPGAVSSPQ